MNPKKLRVSEMKLNERVKLSFGNWLAHYMIVFFLLIPFFLTIFSFIQRDIFNSYKGVRAPEEMIKTTVPFVILAIIFFIIQYKRLNFKTIGTNLTREELQTIIEDTAEQLEWIPIINKNEIIIAKTNPPWWTGSWGEQITILFDRNRILVNSICDPESIASVVSFGRNKKNTATLLKNIQSANR
jgi:heme/copper-type cytochrome/quinol oxidase subunit 2